MFSSLRDPISEDRDRIRSALEESVGDAVIGRIESVIDAIHRGEVEKAVVATRCSVELASAPDPIEVLLSLMSAQRDSFCFMVSPGPGAVFLGASPERLARLEGPRFSTTALAGSAPRGADPESDRRLGAALLASPKERVEHALVVEAIRSDLEAYPLKHPAEPALRKLSSIQHLETPIEADVPDDSHLLELAGRLHPTPALGGSPRREATALIQRLEGSMRGLYGGAVGWVDADGDGELCVAIRSLLLRGRMVTAFAGAGIVADSDPVTEATEMRRKLEVALGALP